MMNDQIQTELGRLADKRALAVAMHKRNMEMIAAEVEFWRAQCEHDWYERSIMGRETATTCRHCGMER